MINKKIVLAYNGNLIDLILIYILKKQKFDIICFINYYNLKKIIFLTNKLKKNNIKKIFIKKINYYFNKIIFNKLKFNFSKNNFLFIKKKIINFIIIKELVKISFYFKTNFLFFFLKKKKIKIYNYYFNKNLNIINIFDFLKLNLIKHIFYFSKKINVNIFKKQKNINLKNLMWEREDNLNEYLNYPLYITLTFKKSVLIKINNIEYNQKEIIKKLNNLSKLTGFDNETCNCYNYVKFINLTKKKIEKYILNKNLYSLKNILINKFFNFFLNKNESIKNKNLILNLINILEYDINGIVKIKIFKTSIYFLNYYLI